MLTSRVTNHFDINALLHSISFVVYSNSINSTTFVAYKRYDVWWWNITFLLPPNSDELRAVWRVLWKIPLVISLYKDFHIL